VPLREHVRMKRPNTYMQRPLWNPLRDSRMPPAVRDEDTDIYGSNKHDAEVYSPLCWHKDYRPAELNPPFKVSIPLRSIMESLLI